MNEAPEISDREAMALVQELQHMSQATATPAGLIAVGPFEAFTLAACLQLAWRHPDLSPDQKGIVEGFARQLTTLLLPRYHPLMELGWNVNRDHPGPGDSPKSER